MLTHRHPSFKCLKPALLVILASLILVPSPKEVSAAFPGSNGRIAWSGITSGESIRLISASTLGDDRKVLAGYSEDKELIMAPRWSSDGEKLTYTDISENDTNSNGVYIIDKDGGNIRRVIQGGDITIGGENISESFAGFSSFNNDGSRISYSHIYRVGEEGDQFCNIRSVKVDSTDDNRLTNDPTKCDLYPVYSPDGSRIAFMRSDDDAGVASIFVMNSDGTGQTPLYTETDGGNYVGVESILAPVSANRQNLSTFDWSPDGSKIVFSEYNQTENTTNLTTIDMDGNKTLVLSADARQMEQDPYSIQSPQYTPEGKILFREFSASNLDHESTEDRTAEVSLVVINSDGTNRVSLLKESGGGEAKVSELSSNFLLPSMQPLPEDPNGLAPTAPKSGVLANTLIIVGVSILAIGGGTFISESRRQKRRSKSEA